MNIWAIGRVIAAVKYGSRRSFAKYKWHKIKSYLGLYPGCDAIDWSRVERIVFVCKGNICRSPFAEYSAKRLGLHAISGGLDTAGGAEVDPIALVTASEFGLDISNHRSRKISEQLLTPSDLVLCMEPIQIRQIKERYAPLDFQVGLLGMMGSYRIPHIPDPHGTPQEYFSRCFTWLDRSVDALEKKMANPM